jgi:hypothetical protein
MQANPIQYNMQMDLTAPNLSYKSVERNGDTPKPTVLLRNALQIKTQFAIQLTQTWLTLFMGTRSPAAVHNPTAAPTSMLCTVRPRRISAHCILGPLNNNEIWNRTLKDTFLSYWDTAIPVEL